MAAGQVLRNLAMRVLLMALTVLGLAACASTQSGSGQSSSVWSEIEISEGMCHGLCPVYTIRVTPDDRYQLNGDLFTRNDGQTRGTLAAGSFLGLAAVLQAHDVASLPADITPNNPTACGESVWSDSSYYVLRLTGLGGRQDIRWYRGCAESPYRDTLSEIREQLRVQYQYETLIAPPR